MFKIILSTLLLLITTISYAENDVTVRICSVANNVYSTKHLGAYFKSERSFSQNINLSTLDLSSTKCVEETHHYKQEYTNKIRLYLTTNTKITQDASCLFGNFDNVFISSDYFGFLHKLIINIDNGHEYDSVNWGVEYDITTNGSQYSYARCKLFIK